MSDEENFDPNFLTHHYDRQGNKITNVWEWSRLFQDEDYKILRRTNILRIFGQPLSVSTVWLGIDHGLGAVERASPPIIFETMVFGLKDELCERYATEEQAKQGHEQVVRRMMLRSLYLARKEEEK